MTRSAGMAGLSRRGAFLIRAAERVGLEGRVVGVDLAEAMLEAARQKANQHSAGEP